MKKILFPLLGLVLFCSMACRKNTQEQTSSTNPYYVQFRQNGVLVKNNGTSWSTLRPHNSFAGQTEFMLASNSTDNKHFFSIYILKPGAITTGTYQANAGYDLYSDYFFNIGQPQEKLFSTITAVSSSAPFTVTFTEITTDYIKGNFTGPKLYNENKTDSLEILDGEFFLKRHK